MRLSTNLENRSRAIALLFLFKNTIKPLAIRIKRLQAVLSVGYQFSIYFIDLISNRCYKPSKTQLKAYSIKIYLV